MAVRSRRPAPPRGKPSARLASVTCLLLVAGIVGFIGSAGGASIVGSRHDLSTGSTTQICEFCHTPHYASTNLPGTPLWNRAETTQGFTLYGSATMNMSVSQPNVISRLCLSCHDGVNAYTMVNGNSVSTKHDLVKPPGHPPPDTTSYPNCERCHSDIYSGRPRTLVIGTNLSNDHPISMMYPTAAQDPDFHAPPNAASGWGGLSQNDVKLFAGSVECGSCHNVHDPGAGLKFLRKSNAASTLCLTCHKK
jgi:predicted CXXCH cytochrome family protein